MNPSAPDEDFSKAVARVQKRLRKEHQRLLRQKERRQATLDEAKQWPSVYHLGQLLQANLYRIKPRTLCVDVDDWELPEGSPQRTIAIDSSLTAVQQVEKYFKKSKKLRATIPHAERLLDEAVKAVGKMEEQERELAVCETTEALDVFCEKYGFVEQSLPKKAEKAPKLPYKAFVSAAGYSIWAGKTAKDNDVLTFHHAKGSDWWLHANDCSGSHVVIVTPKGEEPDEETLRDAAEIALRMSQAKKSGDVAVTQVKLLRRVKSAPGRVTLSKHRVLFHDLEVERWNRLRG